MLDSAIKEQLRTIFAALEANYTFDITVSPQHESRTKLLELLNDVASCSEKLSCRINEGKGLEFTLLKGEHRHFHSVVIGLLINAGAVTQIFQLLSHHHLGGQVDALLAAADHDQRICGRNSGRSSGFTG